MKYLKAALYFVGFFLSFLSTAAPLTETIKKIKPSIVGVGTYLPTRRPPALLMGTGFAVGRGGHIATNLHVVPTRMDSENLERLVIFTGVGKDAQMHSASLSASSVKHDLAILKTDADLAPMLLLEGNELSDDGERVAFIGFPIGSVLGLYPATHKGIISAITPIAIPTSRAKQLSTAMVSRLRDPVMVYQLDATAYPGNSGSPLFLPETGEVIGVLNKVFVKTTKEDVLSKPSGISYAIPVKHLRELRNELGLSD